MAESFTPLVDVLGNLDSNALLEQVSGLVALYWGNPADGQSVLDICGGGKILAWFFDPDHEVTSTALVQQGNHYYIWICGTVNVGQWLGNLTGALWPAEYGTKTLVHGFFLSVATQLWQNAQQYLPDPSTTPTITIVGHSLGGGVAQVITPLLIDKYGAANVETLGIAQPRAFTLGLADSTFGPKYYRVRMLGDPVPQLPPTSGDTVVLIVLLTPRFFSIPWSWVHYGKGYILGTDGSLNPDPNDTYWSGAPFTWAVNFNPTLHFIANIAQYVEKGASP
jgi:hypothetical protein